MLVALAPVLLVLAAAWFLFSTFQPLKGDGEGKVRVTVPEKASVGDIGTLLEKRGVVSSAFFFQVRATVGGDRGSLRPGTYTLAKGMSSSSAIGRLTAGPPANVVQVTVPEGRARSEVADIVKQAGLRGSYAKASTRSAGLSPRSYGARRARDLEGFLYPSTYELKKGTTSRALVRDQLTAFKKNFRKVDMRAARKANLSPYEVLIIASMIDREAQLKRERSVISSVIYNRLRDNIPLGIDATIRFATDNWSEPLTESDLKISSPYNTRTRQGLPPGPIGSPGLAAIRAAARPRKTGFLYYVVKPGSCGEHAFSKTFEQFQKDARRYDTARAQRGGKSPQDC
ncbi:MAG: endolytic transglycosylase MltG [Thermoleophilaceae bacterium]|nr:endolytic transglycosylase MltG [Thermoleophilaceae bacterium]